MMTDYAPPDLERFADPGLQGLAGDELAKLAETCREWCEVRGYARYCVVAEVLYSIHDWWVEHDKYGGVPVDLVDEISQIVHMRLSEITGAADEKSACAAAAELRTEVSSMLLSPAEWARRGYAE